MSDADAEWLDVVAELLLADAGEVEAEERLLDRYRSDDGLHPGATVLQVKSFGDELIEVGLG